MDDGPATRKTPVCDWCVGVAAVDVERETLASIFAEVRAGARSERLVLECRPSGGEIEADIRALVSHQQYEVRGRECLLSIY